MKLLTFKEIKNGRYKGDAITPGILQYLTTIILFIGTSYLIFTDNLIPKNIFLLGFRVIVFYFLMLPVVFYISLCETYIGNSED